MTSVSYWVMFALAYVALVVWAVIYRIQSRRLRRQQRRATLWNRNGVTLQPTIYDRRLEDLYWLYFRDLAGSYALMITLERAVNEFPERVAELLGRDREPLRVVS